MLQPKPSRLPDPIATGSLAQRPVAHLLVYALERKLTGTFELDDEGREQMRIAVFGGQVARISTSEPLAYLGHVLYELGVIDAEALSGSLAAVAATKRLHGQVLLDRGAITPDQLATALRRQRTRKLDHAFRLSPRATFAFYAGIDLVGSRPGDVEPTDPLPAIWRGIRTNPQWDHVQSTIATIGGRALRVTRTVDRLGLDAKERLAAERLTQVPATVAELAAGVKLAPPAADLLAYFLVIASLAEITDRPTRRGPPPLPPPSKQPTALGTTLPSGEYARKVSFSMRASVPDSTPLRIPSPAPVAARLAFRTPASLDRPTPYAPTTADNVHDSSSRVRVARAAAGAPQGADGGELSQAEKAVLEAEIHLALGDRGRASALVRSALSTAPGAPSALVLLAYLESLTARPGQEAYLGDLLRVIDAALVKDEKCRRGYFYRGELRKRLDDHQGAIRDLCAAVKHDPEDTEAVRALRDYEQRVRDGVVTVRSRTPSSGTVSTRAVDPGRGSKPRG